MRALKPARLLEIGTRRGCSTTHLLSALAANGSGELVSLDIAPFLGTIPQPLQARWTFVQADALDWLQATRDEFDFVFEDGAHSTEFTRDALSQCQKFSAALTVSHDAEHFGVGADIRRAWDDVYGAGGYATALIAPSDCGFAYQFAPPVRAAGDRPLLSIVSGTVNRLSFLIAMVQSVRRQLPEGVPYELVLVDGGSTDGTLDWCRKQPDVRLIEQGQLLGAIKAFDAGAEAARGEYVLLLNDDVTVFDGAILRALSYLDSHARCGAVAFADDRAAPGYSRDLHTQTLSARRGDGTPVSVVYAQCGLFRKWLGDLCGWWGSHDPIMGEGHTYGGDSYLSARIWELGYTVDAAAGAALHDRVAPDTLRQRNEAVERQIGSAYYHRYPNGVPLASTFTELINPQRERLRILLATLYDRGHGHYKRGLRDAFARVGWTIEVDWLAAPEPLVQIAQAWQPHLLFTQMSDPALMSRLRAAAPEAVIVNWYGDVHSEALTSPGMMQQSRLVDLQLVVNADVLPIYASEGIQAAYWQIGFEPVAEELPAVPTHDLLFMANAYSPSRLALGKLLRALSPRAGLYGFGWEEIGADGNTLYDFAAGAALYRHCKIALGDNQFGNKGFVSNRLFEALANGAFLLHQTIPGLEELTGLIDGVHYASWRDDDDLRAKIAHYLPLDEERQRIARAGELFAQQQHSFDKRVEQLFTELLPRLKHGRPADGRTEAMAAYALSDGGAELAYTDERHS